MATPIVAKIDCVIVKNTFLSVRHESTEHLHKSRRKSAPAALARLSFDSSDEPNRHVEKQKCSYLHDGGSFLGSESESTREVSQEGVFLLDWDSIGDVYTVMIRGIPSRCSPVDVLTVVHELGFSNLCNFFYVPTRKQTKKVKNLGYAFIGFSSAEVTKSFAKSMTGYRFGGLQSKVVTVTPAVTQGLHENLEPFRNTSAMHSEYKPLFRHEEHV